MVSNDKYLTFHREISNCFSLIFQESRQKKCFFFFINVFFYQDKMTNI